MHIKESRKRLIKGTTKSDQRLLYMVARLLIAVRSEGGNPEN